MAKKSLGRGFDVLIPTNLDKTILEEDPSRVQKLLISEIAPNKEQPRSTFNEQAHRELTDSIKRHGVLQPIIVVPHGKDFRIVAGERRWRAARDAGLKQVPAIIRSLKELEQLEIALIENVQRVDLSVLEQALSVERLHQQFNFSYEEISRRLGKAVSTVHNIVRLLQLPEAAKRALEDKRITEGHARAILALKDHPARQTQLLKHIIDNGWSVRQAERFVTSHKQGIRDEAAVRARVNTETPETKALSSELNTPVHIRRLAKGGKLEIRFMDDAELERILRRISKS